MSEEVKEQTRGEQLRKALLYERKNGYDRLIPGDAAGRMSVRTTGAGDGLFLRNGQLYEITWCRDKRTDQFFFLDSSGQALYMAPGPSYINIVSTSAQITWE